MLGHRVRDVHVARLPHGSAAAPLLVHQPELDPCSAQQLRDRARNRRPVEGRLAVREQHGLAAGRNIQSDRPRADLAARRLLGPAQNGLVAPPVGQLGPPLPVLLMDAALNSQRPHRLDHVDRALAEAVEVAGEERVRAPQFAGAAHRAVHIVLGHVLDREVALLHRNDVGVERRWGVPLVARDLHHRAHLATELVPRTETVVGDVAPLLDERLHRPVRLRGARRPGAVRRLIRRRRFRHRSSPLLAIPAEQDDHKQICPVGNPGGLGAVAQLAPWAPRRRRADTSRAGRSGSGAVAAFRS